MYVERFPGGIDVPTPENENVLVHMEVYILPATKPHPTKTKIQRENLSEMSIEVQHHNLRGLSAHITPESLAVGWNAQGFKCYNPRWGQFKIKGPNGQVVLAGNNGVVWATIIPSSDYNIFGTRYPPYIAARLTGGGWTLQTYTIQKHPKLMENNQPLICMGPHACHRYLSHAKERLERVVEAKAGNSRATLEYCSCNGNHVDPNPAKGRGSGAPIRKGRGKIDPAFFKRPNASTVCSFFPKGMCLFAHPNGKCRNER
jgi:hypothetical protein